MQSYSIGDKVLFYLREADNLVSGRYQPFVSCEIDPSNRCQLDCKWCFFKKYRRDQNIDLNPAIYNKIVGNLYTSGCRSITFTGGGEPLMHPDIVRMIDFAHIHHMKLGLITNGVYLHNILHKLDLFSFIRVSLDCADRESYKKLKGADFFDQVCDNLSVAAKTQCNVGISMVHMKDNTDQVEKFVNLGTSLGVDYAQVKASWQIRNIEQQTSKMSHPDAFVTERYTVKDHLPCKIAGLCGSVAANGKIYYCCVHRGDPRYEVWDLNYPGDFKDIIKQRAKMNVDVSRCGSCRYANFANTYEKVADKKFTMLRHKEFI